MHMTAPTSQSKRTAFLGTMLKSQDSELLRSALTRAIDWELGIKQIEFVENRQEGSVLFQTGQPLGPRAEHEAFLYCSGVLAGFLAKPIA